MKETDRFFETSVELVLDTDSEELTEEPELKNSLAIDTIIFKLRSLDEGTVLSTTSQLEVKKALTDELNDAPSMENIVYV